LRPRWFLFLNFGAWTMAKSKNPFSCAIFNIEHWRTKNIFLLNLPRFNTDQWWSSKHGVPMEFLCKLFLESNVWCQIMFFLILV
jgi:hypothetical protein